METTHVPAAAAATGHSRLLRAANGWWFLGDGGYARLRPGQVSAQGELLPGTERYLRDAGLYAAKPYSSYSLTVLTSTDCNLGCGYCFQNTAQDPKGGSRPPRISHARLTSETITSVLDFTRRRMAEVRLDKLALMLFGGEPLLNPRGARELLHRAAELGELNASMVSNGTLLTPLIAKELNAAGLRSVQVTFDGDRDTHDAIRVRRSGGGTFDVIINNVAKAMAATSLRWHLRVNVSHVNRHGMDDLVERLAEHLDPTRCGLGFELVGDVGVGYGNDLDYGGTLAADFIRWNTRALELGFAVSRPRAHNGCQACNFKDGRYGAVVNADGVLSSCWETAGRPEWVVGTVADGYLPAEQTEDRWIACSDQYQHGANAQALAAFQDEVDSVLLDQLNAAGRL
ncbi:radical SAM protein [Kitasatospora sp. NPDC008050]|uniref:radical SAM protein n=1 Tax=Kitasatospora sp. NPDC008050 TaxID=3364021 RepID=UPI0036E99DBC